MFANDAFIPTRAPLWLMLFKSDDDFFYDLDVAVATRAYNETIVS